MRAAPDHLTDGGWCQILANWVIAADRPWDERLAGWLADDCDALVVQREVVDPAAYVELWLKDAGLHGAPDYLERYDTWLSWFEEQRIEAVGFGWVNLRRAAADPSPVTARLALRRRAADRCRHPRLGRRRRGSRSGSGRAWSPAPTWCRRRSARSAPRTPRRSCCASSAGSAGRTRPTPCVAALVGACDGELTRRADPRRRRHAARAGRRGDARGVPAPGARSGRGGVPRRLALSAMSSPGWYPDPSGQPELVPLLERAGVEPRDQPDAVRRPAALGRAAAATASHRPSHRRHRRPPSRRLRHRPPRCPPSPRRAGRRRRPPRCHRRPHRRPAPASPPAPAPARRSR